MSLERYQKIKDTEDRLKDYHEIKGQLINLRERHSSLEYRWKEVEAGKTVIRVEGKGMYGSTEYKVFTTDEASKFIQEQVANDFNEISRKANQYFFENVSLKSQVSALRSELEKNGIFKIPRWIRKLFGA